MPCCVAVGCSNRDSRGFLMKRFPADPERRSIWAEKVGREDWEPRGSSYLCEVHFAPEMFEQHRADGKRLLKYNAIPTIFPPVPQKKTKKTPVKRPLSKTNTLETSVPVESDAVVAVETPTRNNKKKKQVLPKSSKKDKDHSPKREDDVITARARLTTTLQSLFPESSDDENDISDDEVWPKNLRTPDSSKRTIIDKHNDQDSKYVMKIFDRTIDLAQFNESTPLYPLCRAWIANQPYQMYNIKKESQNDEEEEHSKRPKDEFGFGTVELPRPEPMEKHAPSLRIPDIIPYKSVFNSFMKEGEEPPSKEDLLQDNLQHWLKIRKSWREASLCNEARYEKSIHLLTSMFKKHFIHDDEKFSDFSEGDHWGVYK